MNITKEGDDLHKIIEDSFFDMIEKDAEKKQTIQLFTGLKGKFDFDTELIIEACSEDYRTLVNQYRQLRELYYKAKFKRLPWYKKIYYKIVNRFKSYEYESGDDYWKKVILKLFRIDLGIPLKYIRVKYLDKEDIESLGFKGYVHTDERLIYNKEIMYRGINSDLELVYNQNSKWLLITVNEKTIFAGFCKNKSELKKLMKQLNIIK